MAEVLPRLPYPELVLGLVAPIGADIEATVPLFKNYFEQRGYVVEVIKVTKIFQALSRVIAPKKQLRSTPLFDRYKSHISYGKQLREHFGDNSFLAKTAIYRILQRRNRTQNKDDLYQKKVYILQQFKRKEEIELLRQVYGRLFFQISIYSRRSARIDFLARLFAHSDNSSDIDSYRPNSEDIVQQDHNEIGSLFGQSIEKTFHDADLIINSDIPKPSVAEQVNRFCELLFGSNSISPTKIEYGMLSARSSALRSLDLSRQVGAALFSRKGEIISLGCNEVPKAGGGTYWSDEDIDDRDYKRNLDANFQRKKEILREIITIIRPKANVDEMFKDKRLADSQLMDAIEYGRVVHAEMSAISDAARLGRPTQGGILFTTTFPCHVCAKHIVAAGIARVVFLEPYPKSLAFDLHSDSITVEGTDRGKYEHYPSVVFEHFYGIAPRRYRDMFPRGKRKNSEGEFRPYISDPPQPVIDLRIPVYTQLESIVVRDLLEIFRRSAGDDVSALIE
ncbi:MAG: dCMP deaminase [Bauldia sp.]|nr:dCMP deaminase [Bauldia sp.]